MQLQKFKQNSELYFSLRNFICVYLHFNFKFFKFVHKFVQILKYDWLKIIQVYYIVFVCDVCVCLSSCNHCMGD